jgi:hypothetical protein
MSEFRIGECCIQKADNGDIRMVQVLKYHGELFGTGHGQHYDLQPLTNWYTRTEFGKNKDLVLKCHSGRLRKNDEIHRY